MYRRQSFPVKATASFNLPEELRHTRVPKIELRQEPPWVSPNGQSCRHILDIRDRSVDGGSRHEYWFQHDQELKRHNCAARYLLPVVEATLRERYPRAKVRSLEGTIVLPKQGIKIADLADYLVRELPPYLTASSVSVIRLVRAYESTKHWFEVVDAEGRSRQRNEDHLCDETEFAR
jgi:hypothetical protein